MTCEFRHADWIDDVTMSVPGPSPDQNGISIRIGALYVICVRKPRRVYPVPRCAQATTNSKIDAAIELAQLQVDKATSARTSDYDTDRRLANWWGEWRINLRKVKLANRKRTPRSDKKLYTALCPTGGCFVGGAYVWYPTSGDLREM